MGSLKTKEKGIEDEDSGGDFRQGQDGRVSGNPGRSDALGKTDEKTQKTPTPSEQEWNVNGSSEKDIQGTKKIKILGAWPNPLWEQREARPGLTKNVFGGNNGDTKWTWYDEKKETKEAMRIGLGCRTKNCLPLVEREMIKLR